MDHQLNKIRSGVPYNKVLENCSLADQSNMQKGFITTNVVSGSHANRIRQELKWEKVPVVHTGSNATKVISLTQINGPQTEYSTARSGIQFHASNNYAQEPGFQPNYHPQSYFHHSQPSAQSHKIVKVPMVIETTSKSQEFERSLILPVVNAKICHNFEVVQASLVHSGQPLGPYSSQTFTVDESELVDFDPFKKQESIISSLNLDVPRLRCGISNPDDTMPKDHCFICESDHNNNDDDDTEIMIDTAPKSEKQEHQHQERHSQHPLSPSKSSAGDFKYCNLFRKPSIRRKSNPLAAFLTGGSKEAKKSGKGKSTITGVLPSGLKMRERGCSLTRCPTDSKARLDQLMGNLPSTKNTDPLSDAWTDYIENTYEKFDVVLRKEEEGFGIQLHGEHPVVVDQVRAGGGAAKNGIMKGDIIFKINGNLVVKQSHETVINCFKNAGPFMGLTLLRAPQTGLDDDAKQRNLTSLFVQNEIISNPTPAVRDKNKELEKEKLAMLKSMYEKAVYELEQMKSEAQKNPDDLMMMKFERKAKLVTQLENRISSVGIGEIPNSIQDDGKSGYSQSPLPKLPMPSDAIWDPSLFNQSKTSEIMSLEGLDNPGEDENEVMIQHKEFEDFELLKQSPNHLACFLKYLIQSSNPSYMLFHIVASSYIQSSLKESSQSLRWAFEIYLAFLHDRSPLPLRLNPNIVLSIESCLGSGKDTRSIFQSALSSVQEQIVKQFEEFQHQRTLGLGNFFGEEFLPKPKSSLATSSSFTAPVSYQTFTKPPLSQSNVSSLASVSSLNSSASRGGANLSSSSFSQAKSSNNGSDYLVVEKILWEVFDSCLVKEEVNASRPEETRPAIAACLATFFRHQGVPLSRQNQLTLEGVPSFVWRDKKSLKSRLKNHITMNGHNFIPHQCGVMSVMDCFLCSVVLWGLGYQGYKCHYCDLALHRSCMKLSSLTPCLKVPSKQKSGREENSSTFYTDATLNFNSLPVRKKKRGIDDSFGGILSDSENTNLSELDLVTSPTGTPIISGHGSGPSLLHLTSYDINDSDMEVEQDLPPLSKVISEDALSQLVGVARKKQEIINELFFTERSHVKSLLITIHYYLYPMRNDSKIDQQLVDLLFPNLESITQWHKELSREFKTRRREQVVVHEVGDILMKMFSGQTGLKLQENCAEFCKDQLVNLELLKNRRKQDAYLNQFILNTAQKEICKKQDLKDRLPKVMQRLTKYPLLFDNLLKITPVGTEEHARLLRALKNIRMILDHINETVRESENQRVLLDMQRRMDAKHLENEHHPALVEFKNLQLGDHKLCHYGPLTWNSSANKNIELFIALFQDLMVVFQTQDNRLVLKCEVTGQDSAKFVFIPILKLGNLFVKDAPRTTRTFYLINASKEASQMYTLTAKTKEEREEWMRQIKETTENYKKKHSSPSTSTQASKPSILTETSPCYEIVDAEPAEISREPSGKTPAIKKEVDLVDGVKEDADYDDEPTCIGQSPVIWNQEKELKRQIIATHELMMDKVKALSELHHIEAPSFDLSEKAVLLDTDSDTFISTMDRAIEDMTNFFTSLPDVMLYGSEKEDGPAEWDPIESLLDLGGRLEMLVRQLEIHVLQKNAPPEVAPPVPTSEPPLLDDNTSGLTYFESNF